MNIILPALIMTSAALGLASCRDAGIPDADGGSADTAAVSVGGQDSEPAPGTDDAADPDDGPVRDRKAKYVAVTVDDGPDKDGCGEYLEICRENGIALTFFVIGDSVDANSSVIGDILEAGCEIGNHSWSHTRFSELDDAQVKNEIESVKAKVLEYASDAEVSFFRPPYFDADDRVCGIADCPLIGASRIESGSDEYEETLEMLLNLSDGDIVCLHCWNAGSIRALREAVPKLKDEGYEFVTVSGLFRAQRVVPKAGYYYDSVRRNAAPDYETEEILYSGDVSGGSVIRIDTEKLRTMTEDTALCVRYDGKRTPVMMLKTSGEKTAMAQPNPSSDDRENALFTYSDLTASMEADDLSALDMCMLSQTENFCVIKSVELVRKTDSE